MKHKTEYAPELNRHHFAYHESDYKTRLEKKFRRHHGLVDVVEVQPHRALHRALFLGVPKPPKDEQVDLIDFLDDVHSSEKVERFWGAEAWMRFTIIKQFDNEAELSRYEDTRLHLATQIGILTRKSTEVILPDVEELWRYGKIER